MLPKEYQLATILLSRQAERGRLVLRGPGLLRGEEVPLPVRLRQPQRVKSKEDEEEALQHESRIFRIVESIILKSMRFCLNNVYILNISNTHTK